MKPNLLWIDLETTGLDTSIVEILEMGVVITDHDLTVLYAEAWRVLDWHTHEPDEYVKRMHTENGLWESRKESVIPLAHVQEAIIAAIEQYGAKGSPLCGSTVSYDRAVLKAHASPILDHCSYRNVDVSTLKELAARWGYPPAPEGKKAHRALSDCLDSIAALSHYRRTMFADYRGLT